MSMDSDHDNPYDEKLSDMMARAEDGDLLAAREVAETLAAIVSPNNTYRDPDSDDPNKRIAVPVPDFVREYLSRALLKIASGTDAQDAFHVRKKSGRQQYWARRDKVLAVDIVRQLIKLGYVVDEAVEEAADQINKNARIFTAKNPLSPWKKFTERPIDGTTLKAWLYERTPPVK
jgi:hypothetical protein